MLKDAFMYLVLVSGLLFSGCSSINKIFKSDRIDRRPIVKIPAKETAKKIEEKAQDTIEIAEDIKNDFPEAATEAEQIIFLQNEIKDYSTKIENMQDLIDQQGENLKKERKAAIAAEKQRDEAVKEKNEAVKKAEAKNVAGLVKILYWISGASLVVVGIGVLIMIKVKFSLGLNLVIGSAIVGGLALFTVYFLKWIVYSIGAMVIIGLGYLTYILWDHAREKKFKEELKNQDTPNSKALQKELRKDQYKRDIKNLNKKGG